jgi:hypothetical protein
LEVIFEEQGVKITQVSEGFLKFSVDDAQHLEYPLMSKIDEYVCVE